MVKSAQRGFTFIEISLAMGMTLALLTLIGVYFARGQRYAAETRAYAEAQSGASTLLRKISDQLYRGSYQQRKVDASEILFLSYGANESETLRVELERTSGRIAWKKWVGFYHDPASKTVYKGELPLRNTLYDLTTPADPDISLDDFRTNHEVIRTPMPGKVREFRIQTVNRRVKVELVTEAFASITGNDTDKEIVVRVSGEVAIYN